MFRIPTHDDRGRPARLVRFARPGAPPAADAPLARAWGLTRGVAYSILTSRPGRWMLLVSVVLVTLVWLTAEFGPQVIAFTLFSPVSSTIIILICITGVATTNWIRDRAEQIRRSSIRAGRCPSCAYPIDAIDPEADGCIVCPECGSAWRTNDPRYTLEGEQIVVVRPDPAASDNA